MVRVIHKGEAHRRVFRGTCHRCKSIMEDDEQNLSVEYYQRDDTEFARITCVVCNQADVTLYPVKK